MLEALVGALLEIVFEVVGTVVVELLAEVGWHAFASLVFDHRPHPLAAALGYGSVGALLGGATLLALPHRMTSDTGALATLVLAPIVAGIVMAAVGALRSRRGQDLVRLDSFLWGWLFAFAFALVRYLGATAG